MFLSSASLLIISHSVLWFWIPPGGLLSVSPICCWYHEEQGASPHQRRSSSPGGPFTSSSSLTDNLKRCRGDGFRFCWNVQTRGWQETPFFEIFQTHRWLRGVSMRDCCWVEAVTTTTGCHVCVINVHPLTLTLSGFFPLCLLPALHAASFDLHEP